MRQKLIVGNWKMFTTAATARQLAADIVNSLGSETRVCVGVCPPAPYLGVVGEVVRGTMIALGAQNVYPEKEGAFTGEMGTGMLLDLGCRFVIVGHSERRHILGESDQLINSKVQAALAAGLEVIACVGETLEQRQNGETWTVLQAQLAGVLAGLTKEQICHLVIAYEPVWAIGTGMHATPEHAQEVSARLRENVKDCFGEESARAILIQYGGGINATNAATLMHLPDIDGALVGGASLDACQFLAIVQSVL